MNLYIANTTKQDHMFSYRLQERQQAFGKNIRAGGQILIDNLTDIERDFIIKQHQVYGMRSAKELSRLKGFTGLCYSTTGPVRIDPMLEVFESNDEAKDEEAQVRREQTAAAISQSIGKELGQRVGKDTVPPMRVETQVIEETTDSARVASGVEVTSENVPPRRGGRAARQ